MSYRWNQIIAVLGVSSLLILACYRLAPLQYSDWLFYCDTVTQFDEAVFECSTTCSTGWVKDLIRMKSRQRISYSSAFFIYMCASLYISTVTYGSSHVGGNIYYLVQKKIRNFTCIKSKHARIRTVLDISTKKKLANVPDISPNLKNNACPRYL